MKQVLLFTSFSFLALTTVAQTQLGNGDMELWEPVSAGSEPTNWNSFMTAGGGFNGFADVQIEQSTNVRPGSSGTSSARIWARNAGFGVIANGNMTLGKINMGAISASDPANYNWSDTSSANFSEAFTDMPDSIVFWANFYAPDAAQEARMKATLHDAYPYRDPEDANASQHVVAIAEHNYTSTNGWVRIAVPFDYSGPVSTVEYILVTFTTNKVPGQGSVDDEVFIDDITLIYNSGGPVDTDGDGVLDATEATDGTDPNDLCDFVLASQTETPSATWDSTDCDNDGVPNANDAEPLVGVEDLPLNNVVVSFDNEADMIRVKSDDELNGEYSVFNAAGMLIQSGKLKNEVPFSAPSGIYYVRIGMNSEMATFRILKN